MRLDDSVPLDLVPRLRIHTRERRLAGFQLAQEVVAEEECIAAELDAAYDPASAFRVDVFVVAGVEL